MEHIFSQALTLVKPPAQSRNTRNLEDHFVRAVSLLEGELGVEVRLQQGVSHGGQDPCIYGLLVGLALVRHRRRLLGKDNKKEQIKEKTRAGTKLNPRNRRPLSVEHRHVGGTGERACDHVGTRRIHPTCSE